MTTLFSNDPDQRPRWDFTAPMSHTNDPPTSKIAAEKHVRSGKAATHAAAVLEIVRRHPGRTAVELWELATDAEKQMLGEMQEVRRRLTGLKIAGAVKIGPNRFCPVKGTKQVTWEVV